MDVHEGLLLQTPSVRPEVCPVRPPTRFRSILSKQAEDPRHCFKPAFLQPPSVRTRDWCAINQVQIPYTIGKEEKEKSNELDTAIQELIAKTDEDKEMWKSTRFTFVY